MCTYSSTHLPLCIKKKMLSQARVCPQLSLFNLRLRLVIIASIDLEEEGDKWQTCLLHCCLLLWFQIQCTAEWEGREANVCCEKNPSFADDFKVALVPLKTVWFSVIPSWYADRHILCSAQKGTPIKACGCSFCFWFQTSDFPHLSGK